MAERTQSYSNHVRWLPPFHFFVLPVLLLNVLNQIRHVWKTPGLNTGFALLVAMALFVLAVLSRTQAATVQDRVIRLEMRARLRELLPPDLQPRIAELSPRQLVALRFACDAELPALVRDVLGGRLKSSKEIKLAVKEWQADWLRA